MKKWEIATKLKVQSEKFKVEELIDVLLENRGIKTKEEREKFLYPKLEDVTIASVGIDPKNLKKAIKRIEKAIKEKEQIVVFGDYDVDGICGAAILWETLYAQGANVVPYIPHRVDEGYGLSLAGIANIKNQIANISLIITIDNGITANEAVEFANEQGIDVIITDHHVSSETLPDAYAIVHTTKLCGTGVGWMLAQELKAQRSTFPTKDDKHNHLELVALATVADLVPLTGANRILTKYGLEMLCSTKRIGLIELFKEAVIKTDSIETYHIGHIIAPRLNAMGRLEYAMESLRLLCTKKPERAAQLAQLLGTTNKERQNVTLETVQHALSGLRQNITQKKLLFVADATYPQGVIGLVAGRLVEEYYRPAIVLSIGEEHTKASARSVAGFNIIEFIRTASDLLVNAGGHPMAAGFTVETAKLEILRQTLEEKAEEVITDNMLIRSLRVDCELPLSVITNKFHSAVKSLAPYGMGNPEPVFVSRDVVVTDIRFIGQQRQHVKLKISDKDSHYHFDAIAFGMADRFVDIQIGAQIDIAYVVDINEWQGRTRLQLKIKDIHLPD